MDRSLHLYRVGVNTFFMLEREGNHGLPLGWSACERCPPVRVVGIPHTAVAVPRKATRMPHSERTAEDDTVYPFASIIECRPFWAAREGIF